MVRKPKKSAEDIRAEIDELAARLRHVREEQIKHPESIPLKSRAAVLENKIRARRLLLVALYRNRGAA